MALSRRNGRSRATLLFLVLTSITIITLDFRGDGGGVIDSVRHGAVDAVSPVRSAVGAVLAPVGHMFSSITGYEDLEDENARLKARIADLEGAETQNEAARAELRDLLALNHLDWVGNVPQIAAEVLSAPVSNFEQTIELDRGKRDGIRVDMPVVTGAGLIGRVVDVSGRSATVRLITDPGSSVGVRMSRSGESGVAGGEGPARQLSVGFIEVNANVRRNDLAVTSGLQGGSDLYPSGIPVGRVARAEKVEGELQQRVGLEPLADVAHLRYVKVLRTALSPTAP